MVEYVHSDEFIPRIKSRELLLSYLAERQISVLLIAVPGRWDLIYEPELYPPWRSDKLSIYFAAPLTFASVPGVVGDPIAVANAAILAASFALGAQASQYSSTVPAGAVISQDPAADASAALGTNVFLTVSAGPAPVPGAPSGLTATPSLAPIFEIPLQAGAPQVFSLALGGVQYQFTLIYRNTTDGGWVLDIADTNGNEIVDGIPLVTGTDLLAQYGYLDFGGELRVQTTSDPDAVPTFANLGEDALFYWVPDQAAS